MKSTPDNIAPGTTQRDRISGGSAPGTAPAARADTLRGKPTLPVIGLLAVAMVIGYEWFMSGLVKFVRGGFPAGLEDELLEKSEGAPGWYGDFLTSVVIPNARLFGYLIEISEILAGVALIAGPLIWFFAWDRVSDRIRSGVLLSMAAAAIGGTLRNTTRIEQL